MWKMHISVLCKSALKLDVRHNCNSVRIGDLCKLAKGRQGAERERLTIGGIDSRDLLDVVEDVSVQLEFSPEGCQFRKHRVTRGARHSGLSRETGYGPARTRHTDAQSDSQPLNEPSGRP